MSAHEDESLYRWGGLSAIGIAVLYVVITGLYSFAGAVPTGGQAWLEYLAPQTTIWWAIAILSVLTDLLFLPVAFALCRALRADGYATVLVGAGLLALFALLDLAVTWPNYAALISLGADYNAAGEAQRATLVAAASYPSAVLDSIVWASYAILVPALGILAISLPLLKRGLRWTAYVGAATGITGVIAVLGPVVVSELGLVAILTSILTTVWFLLVGAWLWRSKPRAAA